jgi:hypothetical protein
MVRQMILLLDHRFPIRFRLFQMKNSHQYHCYYLRQQKRIQAIQSELVLKVVRLTHNLQQQRTQQKQEQLLLQKSDLILADRECYHH